jgi:hypothetical protein
MTTEEVNETTKLPRKPRSDKGKRRERAFMAVASIPAEDGEKVERLHVLAMGSSAAEVIEQAAGKLTVGESCEVWQRVGKPRVAQMRLI